MRTELLDAEAKHFSKSNGSSEKPVVSAETTTSSKRQLEDGPGEEGSAGESIEAKRRRILEETRDVDADSGASSSDDSDEDRLDQRFQIE